VSTSRVPADATTAMVVSFTEEEKNFLLERVTSSISVSRSNMQDRTLSEQDHEYWVEQYSLAVRLLTKLGA
jgi:hypothetical protein